MVASGKYSPLELLLESTTTPQAVKDLALQCCQPGPIMRPTFAQISELISAAIPEGADPRPLARIKDKSPLRRISLHSPSTSERHLDIPSGMDQPYRDKFRSRSKTQMDKSYRTEGAASPPSPRTNPDTPAGAFYQTFSDTLLATYMPGKSAFGATFGATLTPLTPKDDEK